MINMKKTQKTASITIILAFLLSACENNFVKDAVDSLKKPDDPVQSSVIWSDNKLLIDPMAGFLSGTISGVLKNGGNSYWFRANQDASGSKKWEFTTPPEAASILEGALSGGKPVISDKDSVITLTFSKSVNPDGSEGFTPGVSRSGYSFILHPDAFYGKDADRIANPAATLNFTIEMPTATNYAKMLIENHEYGKGSDDAISASWEDGSALAGDPSLGLDGPEEGMKYIVGSIAAYEATEVFKSYLSSLSSDNFENANPNGAFTAPITWMPEPDLRGTEDFLGTYRLRLDGIKVGDETEYETPEISVPVYFKFTGKP
jgi:hypothetical protein